MASTGNFVQDVTLGQYKQNPYLPQMGQTLTSQVTDNLNRNILPQLRSQAVAAGGFGGSRQGVIEANALKDANRSISDALTGAYFQDYTNQMNRDMQQYLGNQNYNLGMTSSANQTAVGMANADVAAQNSRRNYELGLLNANNNFYSTNRGQDLQALQLGANLFQQGNQGWLSQGAGMQGIGNTQQQAPWQTVNNANAGLGQWSGYGTTTSANQGGGAQGLLGGALAGGQLGNLWGGTGNASPISTPQPLNANYGLSSGGSYGLQPPTAWGG